MSLILGSDQGFKKPHVQVVEEQVRSQLVAFLGKELRTDGVDLASDDSTPWLCLP